MWRKPNRPHALISQPYNCGIVNIFETKDIAPVGRLPQVQLVPKISLRYDERKVGVERYYKALQNQIEVQRVIRVQDAAPITNQDVAITEDGHQYSIQQVQLATGVYPRSVDLTLADYRQGAQV